MSEPEVVDGKICYFPNCDCNMNRPWPQCCEEIPRELESMCGYTWKIGQYKHTHVCHKRFGHKGFHVCATCGLES